jgi:hypothetical protein
LRTDSLKAVGLVRRTTVWLLELNLFVFAGLGTGNVFDERFDGMGVVGNRRCDGGNLERGDSVGLVTLVREGAAIELLGIAWADDLSTVICVGGSVGVEDPGRRAPGRDAGVELVSSWSRDDTPLGILKMVKRLSLISSGTKSLAIALTTKYGLVVPQYEAGRSYLTSNCSWR